MRSIYEARLTDEQVVERVKARELGGAGDLRRERSAR
jgi:hypothetical protein